MKKTVFILGILGSILIASIPFISSGIQNKHIPRIMPEVVDDTLYYYARTKEVVDGHWLVGNPYFFEDRNTIAPAFFVTDWISAIPGLLGISMPGVMVINTVFWTAIFYTFLFILFRRFGRSSAEAAWGSLGITFAVSWLLVRPVSMQIVFPYFLLLLILFYDWLSDYGSLKKKLLFAVTAGGSFYIYTYLWQAVVLVYVFLLGYELYKKQFNEAKQVFITGLISFVVALPFFYYLYKQITHPFFWQTMDRLGLVRTHSIGGTGILCIVLVIVALVATFYMYAGNDRKRMFFALLFTALGCASLSNVITGKDMETAVHVLRFIDLCLLVLFVDYICNLKRFTWNKSIGIRVVVTVALFIFVLRVGSIYNEAFGRMQSFFKAESVEKLEPVLTFIQASIPKNSVIMADDMLSSYIPVYTDDYVLFQPNGGLHLMSDEELFQRYTLSRMGMVTEKSLLTNMRVYRGVGPSEHVWKNENRLSSYCSILNKIVSTECPPQVTRETYYGSGYYADLYKNYIGAIVPNTKSLLSAYHVGYVIEEKGKTQFIFPKGISRKIIYQDSSFIVYAL